MVFFLINLNIDLLQSENNDVVTMMKKLRGSRPNRIAYALISKSARTDALVL